MFAWAADGFLYNISFDTDYKPTWDIHNPTPAVAGEIRGIFLFGVKPPKNKYIFPPFNLGEHPISMIHPWHFDLSSSWMNSHHPRPDTAELFYAEVNGMTV